MELYIIIVEYSQIEPQLDSQLVRWGNFDHGGM